MEIILYHLYVNYSILKGCLSGEAANVIASIESSSQNYELAWHMLKERYDDRNLMRDNYIQALLNTPNTSKDTPTRVFVDHVQKNLRALKTLGEPIDAWDSIIVVILRNKLHSFLRERWEEHCSGVSKPTINQMITFLTQRAHFESAVSQSCPKLNNHITKSSKQQKHLFSATLSPVRCVHCKSFCNCL